MLRSIKSLYDYSIQATDGKIGKLEQFFFDERHWKVRYLVVLTKYWLRKRVLLSNIAVQEIHPANKTVFVSLSKDQVEKSPDIDTERPISREMEVKHFDYYHWPYYWTGVGIWGASPDPEGYFGNLDIEEDINRDEQKLIRDPSSHLGSTRLVLGFSAEPLDASEYGTIEDFIIDDKDWTIHYLMLQNKEGSSLKSYFISTHSVESISWIHRKIRLKLTTQEIQLYLRRPAA